MKAISIGNLNYEAQSLSGFEAVTLRLLYSGWESIVPEGYGSTILGIF